MFNSLNKGISATKGILIVVLVAVIAGSGILAYQYWWIPKQNFSRQLEICDEEYREYRQTKSYLCYVKMGKDYPSRITELCDRTDIEDERNLCLVLFEEWQAIGFSESFEDFLIKKQEKGLEAARRAARDAARKANLLLIRTALEMYYADNEKYPVSKGIEKINDESCILYRSLQPYFTNTDIEIPVDPKNPEFWYTYESNGKSYELTAHLENLESEDCIMENNICFYKCNEDNCGKLFKEKE